MNRFSYTFLFIVLLSFVYGQENLKPLGTNLNYFYGDLKAKAEKTSPVVPAKKTQATSMFLPFSEDFYYASTSNYPDQNKWSDSMVYVNIGFPIAPISVGVATFDGLNKHGYPYDPTLTNLTLSSPADTLTSRDINLHLSSGQKTLDPQADVALSFYYQARGNGDSPEANDSLILDFYKPYDSTWKSAVWFSKGNSNSNINDTIFKRAFVRVKDTAYFHDGFRFRFRNKASITGNFDNWHLDYIYLDQNRADSLLDTVRNDITIAELPTSFLKNYSSMPFEQYNGSEMASNLSVRIRNNSSNCLNMSYRYRIYDKNNNLVFTEYNGGYDNLNPYRPNNCSPPGHGYSNIAPHAFPAVKDTFALMPTDSTDYTIKHFVFLNTGTLTSNDFIINNDTVIQYQRFRNYYAFDDGSAEAGYYVNGVGGKMALKITLNKPDTLRAMRIYFDPAGNVSAISGTNSIYYFSLNVWPMSNSGYPETYTILKDTTPFKRPIYYNKGNREIPEYKLTNPLVLQAGTYFFGIQQKVAAGISVGFDRNYDNHSSLYFDSAGLGWAQSTFKGSLMIRPVFGKEVLAPVGIADTELSGADLFMVYPNPSSDYFTILSSLENNSYQLLNSLGQVVSSDSFHEYEHTVNTERFNSGIYILVLQNKKTQAIQQQKIIIQH